MTGIMSNQNILPRWRGFNLLNMFTTRSAGPFLEEDFRIIAEWGFDFARLPLCYTLWTEGEDVYRVREDRLSLIDEVHHISAIRRLNRARFSVKPGNQVCLRFRHISVSLSLWRGAAF